MSDLGLVVVVGDTIQILKVYFSLVSIITSPKCEGALDPWPTAIFPSRENPPSLWTQMLIRLMIRTDWNIFRITHNLINHFLSYYHSYIFWKTIISNISFSKRPTAIFHRQHFLNNSCLFASGSSRARLYLISALPQHLHRIHQIFS